MNFSENLKAIREKDGITQEQLAEQMNVSRQTISKWESGASMPELDKLVQLTELFHCTMDGILKGDLNLDSQKESQLYDKHGNQVAKKAAVATGICIMSFALQLMGEYIYPAFFENSGLLFLVGALAGTLLWVQIGLNTTYFRKKHPYIEPFYTDEVKEQFHHRYVTFMIVGIGILISDLIFSASFDTLWMASGERTNALGGFVFLTIAAVGVMLIVYIALLASKYNVEQYNADNAWDHSTEGKKNSRRIGKACGGIMMVAVMICVIFEMLKMSHLMTAIPLVAGGVLCALAAVLLNKRTD